MIENEIQELKNAEKRDKIRGKNLVLDDGKKLDRISNRRLSVHITDTPFKLSWSIDRITVVAEVEREKERLLSDISVEHSKMLSERFELESGINALTEQKKALEVKIEALNDDIANKEEHRDSLEMEVLSFEETTLPRLRRESQELLRSRESLLDGFERKVGEIVQEAKKDLPEAPEAVLDVALVKELGYDDVEDVLLQNLELKRQVTAYRGFWGQIKDTLKDLGMFNALEKAKSVLGLMTNFREPVWTRSDAEKLGQIKNRLNPNHKGFERKLQDAIESARREQERRSKDILGRRQPLVTCCQSDHGIKSEEVRKSYFFLFCLCYTNKVATPS